MEDGGVACEGLGDEIAGLGGERGGDMDDVGASAGCGEVGVRVRVVGD